MGVAKFNGLLNGCPNYRQVAVTPDTFILDYSPWVPEFIDGLTRPLTDEEATAGTYQAPIPPRIAMTGTYDEMMAYFEGDQVAHYSGGPWAWMNDGGPIVPPTEDRVARMLTGTSHSPDEVLEFKAYGTRLGTIEKIAVNAVMAGCKPEYMPAVLAIAEAGSCVGYSGDSSFGHMYLVSGPFAKEVGMNCGFDFFCTGNPANTSLERCCQLMGANLGGCEHGINMLERTGNKHWGTIFAEHTDTPWNTLNVHYGYEPTESILLAFGAKVEVIPFQNFEVVNARDLEECQAGTPAHAVGAFESNTNANSGILILAPDTAHLWAKKYPEAATMDTLEQYFMDNVMLSTDIKYENYWWLKGNAPPEDWVPGTAGFEPKFASSNSITIIVAGGTGDAWSFGFGSPYGFRGGGGPISIDKWR